MAGGFPPKLVLTSATLSSFTPAVLFERFSGDYKFIQNEDDHPGAPMGSVADAHEVWNSYCFLRVSVFSVVVRMFFSLTV
jgi:hypothetical protein